MRSDFNRPATVLGFSAGKGAKTIEQGLDIVFRKKQRVSSLACITGIVKTMYICRTNFLRLTSA